MPTGSYPRPDRRCSLDDCDRKHHTKGYCERHARAFRQHGDPRFYDLMDARRAADTRECRACSVTRSVDEFRPHSRGSGHMWVCRACEQLQNETWAVRNPGKNAALQRRGKVRRAYGKAGLVVLDRIDAGEPCEVCGGHTTKMAVDHCHTRNKVRGLLCGNCNTALGLLKEDPARITRLLEYLSTHA